MLDVHCQCGALLSLPDDWAGKKGKCPACGGVVSIPAVEQQIGSPQSVAPRDAEQKVATSTTVRTPSASLAEVAQLPDILPPSANLATPPAATRPISTKSKPSTSGRSQTSTPPRSPGIAVAPPSTATLDGTMVQETEPVANSAGWPRSRWIAAATAAVVLLLTGIAISRMLGTPDTLSPTVTTSSRSNELAVSTSGAKNVPLPAKPATSDPAAGHPIRTPPRQPLPASAINEEPPDAADQSPRAEPLASTNAPRKITGAAPPSRAASRPGGLTGGSRQYDDFDCQRIQAQHAVRIPAAATMVEVDGQRLPLADLQRLSEARAPLLFLPRGAHAVRFRPGELPVAVEIKGDLATVYQQMRRFFDMEGEIRRQELLSRGARAMDVHSAPFLLNLMGAVHLADDQWEAAERKFRRALRINPLFSPAHLNLAMCLSHRNRSDEARRELELAEVTNVGNTFGLAAGMTEVRRALKLAPGEWVSSDVEIPSYIHSDKLSEEDRRLTALMLGVSKYAVQQADQGKILNNLAIHFADTGRTELALDHFRGALAVIKTAGGERFTLARQVLSHMSDTCRRAGFDEAKEYEQMQSLVTP